MTPQEINQEILKCTGVIGDKVNDLNAMHEAEKTLKDEQWPAFKTAVENLTYKSCPKGQKYFRPISATAAQRAEAFLRTIGKWKE